MRCEGLGDPTAPNPLAIEAEGATIVPFNLVDFELARSLGIEAITPAEMLRRLRSGP